MPVKKKAKRKTAAMVKAEKYVKTLENVLEDIHAQIEVMTPAKGRAKLSTNLLSLIKAEIVITGRLNELSK